MQGILRRMSFADYRFLVEVISDGLSLADRRVLKEKLLAVEVDHSPAAVEELCRVLEREIRYLGSADAAYLARKALGQEPGVSWDEIIQDVARTLKIVLPVFSDEEAKLTELVKNYVGQHFASLDGEKQRKVLAGIGVPQEEINDFLKRNAIRVSAPLLLQVFGSKVVEKIIADLALTAIAGFIGKGLGKRLIQEAVKKIPLWAEWLGPAAWAVSIGWTVTDLQGPALRKTIPIVLYIGLFLLRDENSGD